MSSNHKTKTIMIRGIKCKIDEELSKLTESINKFAYKGRHPFKTLNSCQESEEIPTYKGSIGGVTWITLATEKEEDILIFNKVLSKATSKEYLPCMTIQTCKNFDIVAEGKPFVFQLDCTTDKDLDNKDPRIRFENNRRKTISKITNTFDNMSE